MSGQGRSPAVTSVALSHGREGQGRAFVIGDSLVRGTDSRLCDSKQDSEKQKPTEVVNLKKKLNMSLKFCFTVHLCYLTYQVSPAFLLLME